MRTNATAKKPRIYTHEGARAVHVDAEAQLRRSLMSCMLWEDEFYESGEGIAKRIASLVAEVKPEVAATLASEARNKMKLRHAPLWVAIAMLEAPTHRAHVANLLADIIQRPDELCEVLAMYWKGGRKKIAAQLRKGLAKAFPKFNAYQLAKYNRDTAIKLKDVLFLSHAKPRDEEQGEIWKQLIAGTLPTPDTWEVQLSASKGKQKKEDWSRLLTEGKLGGLALLRNLRNMQEAGVSIAEIRSALVKTKMDRVLPYRFIAAARFAPTLEPELERAMFECLEGSEMLEGETVILIDVSCSMDAPISSKSDLQRIDAACGLGMLAREICNAKIFTFSDAMALIPSRRGFALKDAIVTSQQHGGTQLGGAIKLLNRDIKNYDRLIVITDEQSHTRVPDPLCDKAYIINVASNKNGVGYGKWTHLDGWSEAIIDYIREFERVKDQPAPSDTP